MALDRSNLTRASLTGGQVLVRETLANEPV